MNQFPLFYKDQYFKRCAKLNPSKNKIFFYAYIFRFLPTVELLWMFFSHDMESVGNWSILTGQKKSTINPLENCKTEDPTHTQCKAFCELSFSTTAILLSFRKLTGTLFPEWDVSELNNLLFLLQSPLLLFTNQTW